MCRWHKIIRIYIISNSTSLNISNFVKQNISNKLACISTKINIKSTCGGNVASQQRTFRHEKSRFFAPPSFEGRLKKHQLYLSTAHFRAPTIPNSEFRIPNSEIYLPLQNKCSLTNTALNGAASTPAIFKG